MKKVLIVIVAFTVGFFGFKYLFGSQSENWVSLSDGKTFSGWHTYGSEGVSDHWKIIDGAMVFTPNPDRGSSNLVTDKEYTNFRLSLDWKISEGGNSGIFWGVFEDEKYGQPYQTGPEIQVLDDLRHSDGEEPDHRAGSLYDMIAPVQETANKVGEWNTCVIEIDHLNNSGKVWLNEVEIVSFPVHGEKWDAMVDNSKFKGWEGFAKYRTGRIGLQDHGNVVSYKNVKIIELE